MLKKSIATLAFAGLVIAGCGGDGTDGGGGAGGGGGGAGGSGAVDMAGARLMSGTYQLKNVVKVKDDCLLTLEDGTATTLQVTNTGTQLSLGSHRDNTTDPSFDPAGYSFGTGPYTSSTMATLTVTAHVKISDDGCEFDTTRTSVATFTGNNALSVDYTDNESGQNNKCTTGEPTAACTSHYTFDLSM